MSGKLIVLLFIISLFIGGCAKHENQRIEMGKYRAELSTAGGTLPFFFEIGSNDGINTANLLNGAEIVKIDEVHFWNDSLKLYLPTYNSIINAVRSDSGLIGNLTIVKANAFLQVIPLKAEQNINYLFFPNPPDKINVTGRWAATFTEDDGSTYPAVGEFHQNGSDLIGTFLTPLGDYRYLEGQIKDSTIYLSTFDGGHAYLFKARLNESGKLNGGYWSGINYHESWTAFRDENAKLPDPDKLTYLKKGFTRFNFSFSDLNGKMISLSDRKYHGKVVIVTLAGSWCPNCQDEAGFLSPFYDKYQSKGLEIIALMFENYDDTVRAVGQIKKFRDKFNIKYDLLLAGTNDKDLASKKLPMLNKVLAFPTTIFIDRKGRVRKINTGFSGPGTGEYYIELTDEFTRFVEKLLSEK
jgi:thiol-disulfide isomerase/thioredoxin